MALIGLAIIPGEALNRIVAELINFKKVFGLSILRNERVKRRNLNISGVNGFDLS